MTWEDPPLPVRIAWCRAVYDSLRIGGVWGVPRSGLLFRKDPLGVLSLIEEEAREDTSEWREYQQHDYETIKENMEAAGFHVRREV